MTKLSFGPPWKENNKWERFYPYATNMRDIIPCIRVIRGALCDKERKLQLGGTLIQDQHVFLVVTHSIYIKGKSSLFSYI